MKVKILPDGLQGQKEYTRDQAKRLAELTAFHQPTIDLLREVYKGDGMHLAEIGLKVIRYAIELKLKEDKCS